MAQTAAYNDGKGAVALVTGASRGIGLAVAERLLEEGFAVALNGRDEARLAGVVERLEAQHPGRTLAAPFDVADLAAQQAGVAATLERFGRLDLVIANAGVGTYKPVDEIDEATWKRIIDTNLTGAFFTVKASAAPLKESGGMIVTIASLAGINFFAGGAAYNASKFGLVGFSQAAMLDLRDQGVRVTTILPGSVATEFNDRTVSEADSWKIQPEDIAETVVYLYRMPARTLPSKVEIRPTKPRRS